MNAHRRAIVRTLIAAIFISLPFSALLYAHFYLQEPNSSPRQIGQFLLKGKAGAIFTNDHLKLKVTAILAFAPHCSEQKQCKESLEIAKHVEKYVFLHLRNHQNIDSIKLLTWREPESSLSKNWISLAVDEDQSKEISNFLNNSNNDKNYIILIDRMVQIIGVYELIPDVTYSIEQTLSRLLFDQYLFDYLSSRTFFGPKRKAS